MQNIWLAIVLFVSVISAHEYLPINAKREIAVNEPYVYAKQIDSLLNLRLKNLTPSKYASRHHYRVIKKEEHILRHVHGYLIALHEQQNDTLNHFVPSSYLEHMMMYDCSNDHGCVKKITTLNAFTENHLQDLLQGNFYVIQTSNKNSAYRKTHLFIGTSKERKRLWMEKIKNLTNF